MNQEPANGFGRAATGHQSRGRDASMASLTVTNVVETPTRPSLGRKILVRLMFVGITLALSVAFVEVIGRFLFRGVADDARYYPKLEQSVIRSAPILESTRKPGTFDAKFGYVLSPNATVTKSQNGLKFTHRTNSLSFRTREIEPRLPGEYRVMLVGDSYFYGIWIEEDEALGMQIEQIARSDPEIKRPVRVYNFARAGYCSVQELLVARTYAAQVQPDVIILGFFAANDVIPNAVTRIDDHERFVPVPDRLDRLRNDLKAELGPLRHSLIFRIVSLTGPFSSRLVYRLGRKPWVLDANYEVLRQFESFCRDHGYQFDVVFQHTIDSLASGWRAVLYTRDDVDRSLTQFCERSGIPFVDMREEFKKAGDWQQFIIMNEAHYNARGMRKTAEEIYRQLIRPRLARESPAGTPAFGRSTSSGPRRSRLVTDTLARVERASSKQHRDEQPLAERLSPLRQASVEDGSP
jgi:hypothetical protein